MEVLYYKTNIIMYLSFSQKIPTLDALILATPRSDVVQA